MKGDNVGQRMARITKVGELLMSGLNGTQILEHVTGKLGWPVKQSVVWNYMKEANKMFADNARSKLGDEFGKGLMRLNMLFAASLKIQDYKACLAIQREINLMMGFTNRQVMEHIGTITTNNNINTQAKIQIEYIATPKRIATSEDQIEERKTDKIQDAVIVEENDPNIKPILVNGSPADTTDRPADTTTPPAVPGDQTLQDNPGMPG